MSEFTLSPEERAECEKTIVEVMELATTRAKSGRSSMPIYIHDAALLAGLSARYLDLTAPTPAAGTERGEGS